MKKKALISGITGQDGSYLAEFLLDKGYEVHGIVRRTSTFNGERIEHICGNSKDEAMKAHLHYGDLADATVLSHLLKEIEPDEVYHLGAQSHVRVSFDIPEYTCDITGLGTLRMLDAILRVNPSIKFYQAGSSEMFGNPVSEPPFNEETQFLPQSPYGCAKVFANHITRNYRESYGIFACNGILFNHESPRRGKEFVTRKITHSIARIKAGLDTKLYLGNLSAQRDWGYAPEYVEAMWKMLQQDKPDDYVISTGKLHSVEEFVYAAFSHAGLDPEKYLDIDENLFRPSEVHKLRGDSTKARNAFGWNPQVGFDELVKIMVEADEKALLERMEGKVR